MSTITRGRDLQGRQTWECDVVIVGSGASGAVVADTLSEAGLSVLVLEEGPWVSHEAHGAMRPTESMRAVWRDGAFSAALGVGNAPVINVTMGRCIGGSSTVTGGVCFRTPPQVLDRWVHERGLQGLGEGDLARYFDSVEARSMVATTPDALRSRSTTLFGEGARAAWGVDLQPTRRNMRACDGCAQCNFGCPQHHKMSVDRTFLPRALSRGARVVSDCLVEHIERDGARITGVRGRLYNRGGRTPGDAFTVRAREVVLAAGAVHTPVLLMKSGIGSRRQGLGRHMTLHPSIRMMALFDEPVQGGQGAAQSAFTDRFEDEGVTLISVFVPPAAMMVGVPGVGPDFARMTERFPHMAMFGGLIHDEAGGRLWRIPGREPLMTYRVDADTRPRFAAAARRLAEAFVAAGARRLFVPILGHEAVDADQALRMDWSRIPLRRWEVSSQHPMGTCRMGTDPSRSMIDVHGRVWGVEGLHIVDGSTVPTSLGVNPQLTIMALALRFAEGIRDGWKAGARA
jgi:choline dehydrogenase-like flavoprotein